MTSINSSNSSTKSSSTNKTSSLSAKTGIGGLVSGMDIDTIVESMTASSRSKIAKQQQGLQKLQWRQDSYRSVISKLTSFQNKYLDVLSSTNLRSTSSFNTTKVSSSSDAITASSVGGSTAGKIIINSITQLATNETVKSTTVASKALTGTKTTADFISNLKPGEAFSINLDGKVKAITFDNSFITAVKADPSTFQSKLQSLVDKAFGATGSEDRVIKVSVGSDDLLNFSAAGSTVTLNSLTADSTILSDMGFTSGQSNKITNSAAIGSQTFATDLDIQGSYSFRINGINFTVNSTDSMASVMTKINSSNAGVTITYSSITDKFAMTANNSGSGDNAVISDVSGNLMKTLGLTSAAGAEDTKGVNAVLSVNGQSITRSSNTFTIDGAKVTLNKTTDSATTLTLTDDATALTDTIKNFVADYNSTIDYINGLIKEDVYKDYPPLTDDQKKDMSDSEIAAWEEKAKSGILKGDSLLRSIASKLQTTVAGTSINGTSLYSMGISSAGYTENGKLKITDSKLQQALETKGGDIRELFTSDKGLGSLLDSIITDATKTNGAQGSRGTLVDIAGVDDTRSETENSIFDQMKKTNKNITTLKSKLKDEETRLWNKFSYMESVLNNLNSQSSMISSYFSS